MLSEWMICFDLSFISHVNPSIAALKSLFSPLVFGLLWPNVLFSICIFGWDNFWQAASLSLAYPANRSLSASVHLRQFLVCKQHGFTDIFAQVIEPFGYQFNVLIKNMFWTQWTLGVCDLLIACKHELATSKGFLVTDYNHENELLSCSVRLANRKTSRDQ